MLGYKLVGMISTIRKICLPSLAVEPVSYNAACSEYSAVRRRRLTTDPNFIIKRVAVTLWYNV